MYTPQSNRVSQLFLFEGLWHISKPNFSFSDAVTRHKRVLKCFPGQATVLTESGIRKSMSELRVGDRVAVLPRYGNDHPVFEPVIAFLHRDTFANSDFIKIQTDHIGRFLTASSEHLVYVWTGHGNLSNPPVDTKSMDRMAVGDTILVSDGNATGPIRLEKVISVESVHGQGLYAPLTKSGTIFVDDVLASCYAAVGNERMAHHALVPLRLWHHVTDFLGSSGSESSPEPDGIHWYAELLLNVAEVLERWGFGKIIDHA